MSLLSLYIPEHWDADTPLAAWTWRHDSGSSGTAGDGQALPAAREVRLVLPAERVLHTLLDLPRRGRWQEALPYALEDRLLTDAESMHVAAGGLQSAGQTPVAAVARHWLEQVLQQVGLLGVQAHSAYSEASLAAVDDQEWLLLADRNLTLLVMPGQVSMVLDQRPEGGPPRMLAQLLEQAEPAHRPQRLRLRLRPGCPPPAHLEDWQGLLGLAVLPGEDWKHDLPTRVEHGVNLLQGRFAPLRRSGAATPWRPFRPALLLALAAAVVWLGAVGVQTVQWSREARALQARGDAALLRAFPETRTILDAPLQMQRGLDALRARAGGGGAGELPALLGRTAGVLDGSTAHLQKLDFHDGVLNLRWHCPDEACLTALRQRLTEPERAIVLDVSDDALTLAAHLGGGTP